MPAIWTIASMSTVIFYTHVSDKLKFACRFIRQVYPSQSILVWFNSEKECVEFNQLLWEFEPTAFVPHEIFEISTTSHQVADSTVVMIGFGEELPEKVQHTVVLNLSDVDWTSALTRSSQRIVEIIPNDLDALTQARSRFRWYRQAGLTLEHHNMQGRQ